MQSGFVCFSAEFHVSFGVLSSLNFGRSVEAVSKLLECGWKREALPANENLERVHQCTTLCQGRASSVRQWSFCGEVWSSKSSLIKLGRVGGLDGSWNFKVAETTQLKLKFNYAYSFRFLVP